MAGSKMGIGNATLSVGCAIGLVLGGCNDANDRVTGDAAGDALEALSVKVQGTVCGKAVSYDAPDDTTLTLVVTPSGLLQGLVLGDGPLTRVNDFDAMETYGEGHDFLANVGLEEPAALGIGSLSGASVGVRARGFGSLASGGNGGSSLEIREYERGGRIAGSVTLDVGWFSATYPERADPSCTEGEVTLSFSGGFTVWDGQADCYSPNRNLDHLASGFALGCSCDPSQDAPVCVNICEDPSQASGVGVACDGMAVALFCTGEQWQWGYDGPCH